ncbi:MAG: TatD family hydrolase [Candidatus Omnitrophica bacterium]|nr:TatD family hydrolase [Candidatus Omnitrophota bacterium]
MPAPSSMPGIETGLVDTHAHMFFQDFDRDRDEVFQRARASGVERFVLVGTDAATSREAVALARSREDCVATVGFHPHYADRFSEKDFDELKGLAAEAKVVAVGEVGLDYFKGFSNRENQRLVLTAMLGLARDQGLPVVFHCRDAHEGLISMVCDPEWREVRAVVHCFTGSEAEAAQYLERGFFISFAGQITFKNARALVEVARKVPLDRIFIETDCPYLAPDPHRGTRNEPARCVLIARRQAELHGVTEEEAARITTANAGRFFGPALGIVP